MLTSPAGSSGLHIADAMQFYRRSIWSPVDQRAAYYRRQGTPATSLNGSVPPVDWEIFCAILLGLVKSSSRRGLDLLGAEVKSAALKGSYEYQYHRESWSEKAAEERGVQHVFVEYEPGYRGFVVRILTPRQMRPYLDAFRQKAQLDYSDPKTLRCRPKVPCVFVRRNGAMLLIVTDSRATNVDTRSLSAILSAR